MKIFGIMNVTPDSFSGTGDWEGADVVDIGAESTRPNATPISPEEEIKRLEAVFNNLPALPISLDTRHPQTAAKFATQIQYLNDVSGFDDAKMVEIAAKNNLAVIAMHSLTVPANPEVTINGDAVDEILRWNEKKFHALKKAGIKNIILDVGIGFGKTPEQNWQIIENIQKITNQIHALGAKILVGHSRKSFLATSPHQPPKERDEATSRLSISLHSAGVDYIRVHNVKLNQQAIGDSLLHPRN